MLPPIALETAQHPQSNSRLQTAPDVSVLAEFEAVLATVRFEANEGSKLAETEANHTEEQVCSDGENMLQKEPHQGFMAEPNDTPGIDEDLRELSNILSHTDQTFDDVSAQIPGSEPSENFEEAPPFIAVLKEQSSLLTQDERSIAQDSEREPQHLAYRYAENAPAAATSPQGVQSNTSGQGQTNDVLALMESEQQSGKTSPQAVLPASAEAKRTEMAGYLFEKAPENIRDMTSPKVEEQGLLTDMRGLILRTSLDGAPQLSLVSSGQIMPENANVLRHVQAAMNGFKDVELHGGSPQTQRTEPLNKTSIDAGSTPIMPFTSDKIALSVTSVVASGAVGEELANSIRDDGAFPPERSFLPVKEAALQARIAGYASAFPVDHSTSVARQVADVVRISPGGVVDISLRPDELGAVRLSMKAIEGQMTVIVQAERSDTLDLMRRNIEGLSHEFKELGYDSISFSFQSGGDNQNTQQQGPGSAVGSPDDTNLTNRAEDQRVLLVGSGLDIRI